MQNLTPYPLVHRSSIKETGTVACRACCDLVADRRLCLTGTPVQNKLDDVFALIKFLRLHPFDDKNVWTEYIGNPVKYGRSIGVVRLQTIMKCITLRRTKETKGSDGNKILSLPPRYEELRYLKFDSQEQQIYDRFFKESKDEFTDLSRKNEVMKNYVGILQKILRLRQICDHFELVDGKEPGQSNGSTDCPSSYEDIVADIGTEGFSYARATAIFAILRESATAQCVECGGELVPLELQEDATEADMQPSSSKRVRKCKNNVSRPSTRASSPSTPRPVLTRCQHLFCIDCYRDAICPGWPNVASDTSGSCSACQTPLFPADAYEVKIDTMTDGVSRRRKAQKREKRQKGQFLENFVPSTKINSLLHDLTQFSFMNPHSANYDSELEMTDSSGSRIEPDVVKTVVLCVFLFWPFIHQFMPLFSSQWTSMLDKYLNDSMPLEHIFISLLGSKMRSSLLVSGMND